MNKYFDKENNTIKACMVKVTDYYGNVIVSYPSLLPAEAVDSAKKLASYYRPKYAFLSVDWEVEIKEGEGGAKTWIYDTVK